VFEYHILFIFIPNKLRANEQIYSLMMGTKFGQGTRGMTKIRNGDIFGAMVATIFFFKTGTTYADS
jgi:hypothetical protein